MFIRKRIIAACFLVFVTVLVPFMSQAVTNPFPDTDIESLEGKAAADLYARGIIQGFPDGEFKGAVFVNRAQVAKILLNANDIGILELKNDGRFLDVQEGEWYVPYIMTAERLGILSGYPDGTFRPDRVVNTAEFMKLLSLTFGTPKNLQYAYEDVHADQWYAQYMGLADAYDLFPKRTSRVCPPCNLDRNDTVAAIYQYIRNSYAEGRKSPEPLAKQTEEPSDPPIPVLVPPGGEQETGTGQVTDESDADQEEESSEKKANLFIPQVINVSLGNDAIDPKTITVKQGANVSLIVKAVSGSYIFAIPDFDIERVLAENSASLVHIPTDTSGIFEMTCNFVGHTTLHGTGAIVIVQQ